MKRLALLVAVAAGACTSGSGGTVATVQWSILVASASATCQDVGATDVEFTFALVGGPTDTHVYFCTDLSAVIDNPPLPGPGSYHVTATLWHDFDNALGERESLSSGSLDIDILGRTANLPQFVFQVEKGRFNMTWTVLEGGLASTCANIPADTFEISFRNKTTLDITTELFDCSDMAGESVPLDLGMYDATARLLFGTQELSAVTFLNLNLNVKDVNLPLIAFDF